MKKVYIHSLILLGIGMIILGVWSLLNPTLSLRTILIIIAIILIFNRLKLYYILFLKQNVTVVPLGAFWRHCFTIIWNFNSTSERSLPSL